METDLLLIHPPAYLDFRNEKKVYFPYMSTSGDVPITPSYEYFPIGFKGIKKYLTMHGYTVYIFNLAAWMTQNPNMPIEDILPAAAPLIIGIDLHWLIHVHGSIELAKLLKEKFPETKILFGGISANYYASELIQLSFIDFVMRGYDTLLPMKHLLDEIHGSRNYKKVPNLLWKEDEFIRDNKISYLPAQYNLDLDWKGTYNNNNKALFPIRDLLSINSAGCKFNCGWCGGSRESFKRIYPVENSIVYRNLDNISLEIDSFEDINESSQYNYYFCGSYNDTENRFERLLNKIIDCDLKTITYEQFFLTKDHHLKKMGQSKAKTIISISPESHDINISKKAGRGVYSMEEMERWIEKALTFGIYEINIWFFIGMPDQNINSVKETVEYCDRLLYKFRDKRVVPYICPMMPFLDVASNFFTFPQKYGYKVFFKSLKEYYDGMKNASIINRMNYETKWLSREEIVYSSYDAMIDLFDIKSAHNQLPQSVVKEVMNKLTDAKKFIKRVHVIDNIKSDKLREAELKSIENEIYGKNKLVFYGGVENQGLPMKRKTGSRWIDVFER